MKIQFSFILILHDWKLMAQHLINESLRVLHMTENCHFINSTQQKFEEMENEKKEKKEILVSFDMFQ